MDNWLGLYNIIPSCVTLTPSPATSESGSGKDKHTDNYTATDTLTHRGHAPRVSLPLEIGTSMSDYIDEYGDEIESVEASLAHALEIVATAKEKLQQDNPRWVVRNLPGIRSLLDASMSEVRGIVRSLESDTNK